jgi:dihydroorotate dehydrogenase electron transfer subunit
MHIPRIVEIKEIYYETETITTIFMEDEKIVRNITPGQFIMVWIPGLDEIPMGISHIGPMNSFSITVENIGEATDRLSKLRKGDLLGLRGPYGNGFSAINKSNLIIGGGSGMAPLVPLIDNCQDQNVKIKVILGAKNANKLPFIKYIRNTLRNPDEDFLITTEDGSTGKKGLVTDILIDLIKNSTFDNIYAVGPELMLKAVYEIALEKKLNLEVSLERYFKCGIGICGSCCIGEYRVCEEGPVFNMEQLKKIDKIFGHYSRDASGRKIELEK